MVTSRLWGVLLGVAVLPACETAATKVMVVPAEMRRPPAPSPGRARTAAAGTSPVAEGSNHAPSPKYVLRMAENGRVWEMELPESLGGYEVRLPMAGGGPLEMLTAADEEMLAESVLGAKKAAPGVEKPAESKPLIDANQAARTRSYLGGVARVKEMYAAHRYELALIELVGLEQDYPQDARLLAMKGSLYLKLNQPKLARQAWEKALSINPDDAGVAEALRATAAGEE